MKKVMAILLVLMLVAGFGGAYALAESDNSLSPSFRTNSRYKIDGDSFTNAEVTGYKSWFASLSIREPVTALSLRLNSDLAFDSVKEDNLTQPGPPVSDFYEWSLGDVSGGIVSTYVRFEETSPNPFPVTFTPGVDVSRSADITEFSEPGEQTLTLVVTPQVAAEGRYISMHVNENDRVSPRIIAPVTDNSLGIRLSSSGTNWSIRPPV